MKKRKSVLTAAGMAVIAMLIIILTPPQTVASNNSGDDDDNFSWQEVAREMDAMPFSRAFIDSVTQAHIGGPTPRALRKIPATPNFARGETLVYEVRWGAFKGGYLILNSRTFHGRGLIRLGAKAMTSTFVSSIYRVRNYDISWVDAEGFYPHFFEHHAREGKGGGRNRYVMDAYVVFDNKEERIFHRRRRVREIKSPQFTHDHLSVLYYARTKPLRPGDAFEAQMFFDGKTDPIRFRVNTKRETIQVPAGAFNCVKVEPTLTGDGGRVFGRRSKMEVWVSDDEHKYPVMLRSKAKIGSINARLVMITRGQ